MTEKITLPEIVPFLKKGRLAYRNSWIGKDMYLRYITDEQGDYFECKKGMNKFTRWTPDTDSIVANDWVIVEQETFGIGDLVFLKKEYEDDGSVQQGIVVDVFYDKVVESMVCMLYTGRNFYLGLTHYTVFGGTIPGYNIVPKNKLERNTELFAPQKETVLLAKKMFTQLTNLNDKESQQRFRTTQQSITTN